MAHAAAGALDVRGIPNERYGFLGLRSGDPMKLSEPRSLASRCAVPLAGMALLAALLSVGAASCDNGDASGGVRICVPGSTQSCYGPAACVGGQFCQDDGQSWSSFDCGGPAGTGGKSGGGAGGKIGTGGTGTGGMGTGGTGTGGTVVDVGTGGDTGTGGMTDGGRGDGALDGTGDVRGTGG